MSRIRQRIAKLLSVFTLSTFTAAGQAQVTIVNMIPNSRSGETQQDSEPNLAVNPANPQQIAGSAFTPDPLNGSNAPIYVSTNGGATWVLNSILPGNGMFGTKDVTLRFSGTSNNLYAGILRGDSTGRLNILRTANFTAPGVTVLVDRTQVDQPYVQATTAPGGADRVYVGNNDLGAKPRSATIDVSLDGLMAAPPPPANFVARRIETRDTYPSGQDGPPIRPIFHSDGTVYAVFYGLRAVNGSIYTSDLVVVRDDNWAAGATQFAALIDPGDFLAGRRVVTGLQVPFNSSSQPSFGQERFVLSNISITVDPRTSSRVYVAWADYPGGNPPYTLHVRRSDDRGATWSTADLITVASATNPALAVNSDGQVGFLYQQVTGASPQRWETHLRRSSDLGVTWNDLLLARPPANTPAHTFVPYIGDYVHLMALGRVFYGIFSANNTPDLANFPQGVTYQRNANFNTQTLLNTDNATPVAVSIDPFFFTVEGASTVNYAGTLDHAGCDTLEGWAADRNRLNTPITVSFYDNGTLFTTVLANLSRPDVGAVLGDNGLHGFAFATPASLRDGNTHVVDARFEGSSTQLVLSPVTLTCSSQPPPVASFTFVCTGLFCTFDGSGSTGTGLTYSWSFGDSSVPDGTGVTTAHGYPNVPGITDYTVTLTVKDSLGRQASKSKRVSVVSGGVPVAPNYFAVTPCRVLDTRNSTILTNGQTRVVSIAGSCGIPSDATAVSFNVTAVSPTGSGKIRLFPGDLTASWSGAKSSINFAPATSPRANSAVILLATNGAGTLGIYPEIAGSPGQVHLILDIQGYFNRGDRAPAPGAQGPLGFQTLPPCRMADTRLSNSPLVAGTVRTFTAQGVCGVPAVAAVASLHVGVPGPTASGFITLFPSNIARPVTSTINFQSGISDLRNGARVNLSSTTPDLAAYFGGSAGTSVHAYFDVNGYFKSDAPLTYHPALPCRAVDSAVLTNGTVSTFQIRGNCGVPVEAKAALLHLVVSAPTSSGNLTVYPSNLPLSSVAVSTVNFDANEPGLSMGTIIPLSTLPDDLAASPGQMTTGGTMVLSIDVFGYFQ